MGQTCGREGGETKRFISNWVSGGADHLTGISAPQDHQLVHGSTVGVRGERIRAVVEAGSRSRAGSPHHNLLPAHGLPWGTHHEGPEIRQRPSSPSISPEHKDAVPAFGCGVMRPRHRWLPADSRLVPRAPIRFRPLDDFVPRSPNRFSPLDGFLSLSPDLESPLLVFSLSPRTSSALSLICHRHRWPLRSMLTCKFAHANCNNSSTNCKIAI